jgi:predicted exporter
MKRPRAAVLIWLAVLAIATFAIARARFTADLSAFLPTTPTPEQALLIDQLREGPASHLVLVAIEGAPPSSVDDHTLARLSKTMAKALRGDPHFLSINDGENANEDADRRLLFEHRYLMSDRVTPERFTTDGLHAALNDSLDLLASSAGLMLQPLIKRDPTAELLHLVDTLTAGRDLASVDGAWVTTDAIGRHALLVAETRAAGSDIDGQEAAVAALRQAFTIAKQSAGPAASSARLLLSGLPVFAVDARSTIEREAAMLSSIGLVLVALLLGFVYRSARALVLGLVPMATGAACGLAVVATGFGVVHGITLGFGVTLIGEAVDYAIYLFVQRPDRHPYAARRFWRTIALGVGTSAIGFGALLFSGFAGLAQIGLLSIVGLVAAALVTRWVLPALMPAGFAVRSMPGLGTRLRRTCDRAPRLRVAAISIAVLACIVIAARRDHLWSRELSSLSSFTQAQQDLDQRLRGELGAPDVRDLVVVSAPDQESALRGSEAVASALAPFVADGTLAGIEAPSRYLPSVATQRRRQAALPDDAALRDRFARALDGLPFTKTGFDGFFEDVAREKNGNVLTREDLDGTSIAPALRALLNVREDGGAANPGSERWTAMVALRSPPTANDETADVARLRIRQAVARIGAHTDENAHNHARDHAHDVAHDETHENTHDETHEDAHADAHDDPPSHPRDPATLIRLVDIKSETQNLYAGYLSVAVKMAGLGALGIVALLAIALRSAARLFRVLFPLTLAVAFVTAGHVITGNTMNLFHLVGLLLIVGVGSNYALFFDRRARGLEDDRVEPVTDDDARMLTSLVVANLTAVIGFGVLALSSIGVLNAIGTTVAPGAFLALCLSAVFARPVGETSA